VLVYMFIGYEDPEAEARQVQEVAAVAGACEALGIGCIIEPMARGLRVGDAIYRAEFIALGARMACENRRRCPQDRLQRRRRVLPQVVAASFRPILIAGGPKTDTLRQALSMVSGALAAGATGCSSAATCSRRRTPPDDGRLPGHDPRRAERRRGAGRRGE
jgi:DhnA family fructose-bisphosphate aldolase class Ia